MSEDVDRALRALGPGWAHYSFDPERDDDPGRLRVNTIAGHVEQVAFGLHDRPKRGRLRRWLQRLLPLLLLALPTWGQETLIWHRDYEWVTTKVDSANLGEEGGCMTRSVPCPQTNPQTSQLCYETVHDWVYSEPYTDPQCMVQAIVGTARCPTIRERICRVCLRHEWQRRVEVAPPPSEFEKLKERLR